jgi:SAM-dependent methyltransferase
MEGLIPVLMRRGGARRVVAADASYHCFEKIRILQKQYGVSFDFQQIGLMYDLSKKVEQHDGFDLVVLGGVLYHVFSPLHVLAGVRPLLRENGLFIVSTNVVNRPEACAVFNDCGRLQTEVNTFWYLSVPMLEYALRYFGLLPIDYVYVPHAGTRYRVAGLDSGLMTVVCRASKATLGGTNDDWASRSSKHSWEYRALCDTDMVTRQPTSNIHYRAALDERLRAPDGNSIDLRRAVELGAHVPRAERHVDSYVLRLSDES